MKKIVFAITVLLATSAIAQNATIVELEERKIKQALLYGDKDVATSAMYNIIAIQGPESIYKDSLAYLYFNKRNYISCFLVIKDILERKPENMELLEMSAISLESIGAKDVAIESYEKLLAITKKSFHAYKIAGLQFEINKFDSAYVSIKKADQLPTDDTINISFKVNATFSQNINLKASIAYLEGMIAINLDKKAAAKIAFERALKFFPEFVLAKTQLETLNEN